MPAGWRERLRAGVVIPAHPLALTAARRLDERRQRALTRYYAAAGAGGIAVGVHTTQFEIHNRKTGLLEPVLALAAETLASCEPPQEPLIRIAGLIGDPRQAVAEAEVARRLGYQVGLLSTHGAGDATLDELVERTRTVARVIPVMGFYLQPAVGGRVLPYEFWRRLLEIEGVVAIKAAPFNRYQTLEVARAIADAGRTGDVVLYTGNDDHILLDLLTAYRFADDERPVPIVGGLLGHWAFWTRRAVEHLARCRELANDGGSIPSSLLTLAAQVTDANGAIFDTAHGFAGCMPGIHEILRRQGLLAGTWCVDPRAGLSPGQQAEIDRVLAAYPHLTDDAFVAEHLDAWLA